MIQLHQYQQQHFYINMKLHQHLLVKQGKQPVQEKYVSKSNFQSGVHRTADSSGGGGAYIVERNGFLHIHKHERH